MKWFVLAFILATADVAAAQTAMPQTLPLTNANGDAIGTGTRWGNKITLRDVNGELIGTIVFEANGARTFYDPNGKLLPLQQIPGKLPQPEPEK